MKNVYLLSCVSKKLSRPAKAKNFYVSTWFRKAQDYIGQNEYYILSAKYGLISPDQIIEPYEKTLNKMDTATRKLWADDVVNEIIKTIDLGTNLIFLAGNRYREFVIKELKGYTVEVPMIGLGIGQQLKWFKDNTQ